VRLHAAAGDAILARTPSPEGEALDAVAMHFGEAAAGGDVARAIEWCVRAARRAASPDDALEHLDRAARAALQAESVPPKLRDTLDRELSSLATRTPAIAARASATRQRLGGG
jgi:hypothetical protein